ncbi:MAG: hypothetical protein FRX48_03942 [Lasallia pustulata]|uniref:Uncharacterized protein n=1 Tax=Lasallia pustulata TaxID=136370 RepID=A0A5M8PS31_9LECA|nr:MAG: hypothetical protein FRX48_03942 [Lasallia pustulata]
MASKSSLDMALRSRLRVWSRKGALIWPRKPPRYGLNGRLNMASRSRLDMPLNPPPNMAWKRRLAMASKAASIWPQWSPQYGLEKPPRYALKIRPRIWPGKGASIWPRRPPRYGLNGRLNMASKSRLDMVLKSRLRIWSSKGALIWPRRPPRYGLNGRLNMAPRSRLNMALKGASEYGVEKAPQYGLERRLSTGLTQ